MSGVYHRQQESATQVLATAKAARDMLRVLLSRGAELHVLDGDAVEGEVEVVDGAHDGGVEAVVLTCAQFNVTSRHGHHQAEWRLRMS